MSRLLLISCSQRKQTNEGVLPAIDRYDGPSFRLLRRYLRQSESQPIDVKILSAEYGLIDAGDPLPYYDCRITKEQSKKLNHQVIAELKTCLSKGTYTNFLICLGKDYFAALYGYEAIIPPQTVVQLAVGGMGRKLSILHDWLYGSSPRFQSSKVPDSIGNTALIRGVEVNLTPDQILDVAREAIATKDRRATHYQSWYVQIDDQRVAPKWLVSQITGLPVSSFVTDDARRVLNQLGVEVKRI